MKKLLCMMVLFQCGFMAAQTKTLVTVYGEKVQINPNSLNTADNGLTATNGNIQFGGALTKASVLTTTDTFTLAIKGLQAGAGTDDIVVVDGNGILKIVPKTNLGDNLGNHTATKDLAMSGFNITNAANITATAKTTTQTAQIIKGTDGSTPSANSVATSADANGNVVWKTISSLVDGSETKVNAGTNVTVTGAGTVASPYVVNATSTADNLGNHTATQDLNMSSKNINNINTATINYQAVIKDRNAANTKNFGLYKDTGVFGIWSDVKGNTLTIDETTGKTTVQGMAISKGSDGNTPATNSLAVSADTNGNVIWKNISSLVDGSETKVNAGSNVTVTGAGTVASPYVVNATSTADNLGNHTATQDLNMSSKNITAAANVTATAKTTTQTAQIIAGTDSSAPIAGSVAVSADTNGNIKWANPAQVTGVMAIKTVSSNYTPAATDNVILVNAAPSSTINIYINTGVAGKVFTIKRIDDNVATVNIVFSGRIDVTDTQISVGNRVTYQIINEGDGTGAFGIASSNWETTSRF